jgi:hypothetical protein
MASKIAPKNALIILDWDDTLNPSSWCIKNRITTVSACDSAIVADLRRISAQAAKTLTACMEVGDVVIVTNAESGWVQLSAKNYMPEVNKILDMIPVVSARSSFEIYCRDAPVTWKALAFRSIIAEWNEDRAAYESLTGSKLPQAQVISIGDSNHEREALLKCSQHMGAFVSKSVKLLEKPSAQELNRQHELLCRSLSGLLQGTAALDLFIRAEIVAANFSDSTIAGCGTGIKKPAAVLVAPSLACNQSESDSNEERSGPFVQLVPPVFS